MADSFSWVKIPFEPGYAGIGRLTVRFCVFINLRFAPHCSAANGIIPGNETKFSGKETIPNTGEGHPAMRHGLASRGV